MKQFIEQNGNYCIFRVDSEYLHQIAEFIVMANYSHHSPKMFPADIKEEIKAVYQEELTYISSSQVFLVENNNGKMIGCIRVMKWNKINELPIQKIFNINPLDFIHDIQPTSSIWHIGRFAVDSCADVSSVSLFKQLMVYAIAPICQELHSYMIAECDSKLLRVMGLLGIDTIQLGKGIHYLGSETIPVYSTKEGLQNFYNKFKAPKSPVAKAKELMRVA